MFQIDASAVAKMLKDQDAAAASYWAYPDEEWQAEFQATWLADNAGHDRAQCPDGLVWGAASE